MADVRFYLNSGTQTRVEAMGSAIVREECVAGQVMPEGELCAKDGGLVYASSVVELVEGQ